VLQLAERVAVDSGQTVIGQIPAHIKLKMKLKESCCRGRVTPKIST
jgi:hypothetical protein